MVLVTNLTERIDDFAQHVRVLQVKRDSLIERKETLTSAIQQLQMDVEDLEKIHGIITQYAQTSQETFLRQVEDVVTRGLVAIFEEPMSFRLEQVVSGKRLEVRFFLTTEHKGESLETGIMDARGGGVGAVIGFLLRVSILLLIPQSRHILVLDETFAQLSTDYLPNLSEFIRQLVDKTGVQIVMVTHQPALAESADCVYSVSHNGQETIVKSIDGQGIA